MHHTMTRQQKNQNQESDRILGQLTALEQKYEELFSFQENKKQQLQVQDDELINRAEELLDNDHGINQFSKQLIVRFQKHKHYGATLERHSRKIAIV